MKKLWETEKSLDAAVEAYTVGEDHRLDERLLRYEILGSLAHAKGLVKIGILSAREFEAVKKELVSLKSIKISREQEDLHTAVEHRLIRRLGEIGEKIHAGRSRNDQVQVDLRLYLKDNLLGLMELSCEAAAAWEEFGRNNENSLMPGYTHLQRAMPTTVGHWAASHAEALVENLRSLCSAYEEVDACPLGSAAGFGAALKLDRALVVRLLGFSRVQRNTLRVQTSRPRVEAAAVSALALLARDLGALAWDLSLYCSAEFGFFRLDGAFTTGSSLMPQKKNPDVVELTRGKAALFPGWLNQILSIGQMPSGYHRDYQLTKGPLMAAVDAARQMLDIVRRLPERLSVDAARCAAAVTDDMLATQKALGLVEKGVPFRQAYREVAAAARAASPKPAAGVRLALYLGTPGRPGWGEAASERSAWQKRVFAERARLEKTWKSLSGS